MKGEEADGLATRGSGMESREQMERGVVELDEEKGEDGEEEEVGNEKDVKILEKEIGRLSL